MRVFEIDLKNWEERRTRPRVKVVSSVFSLEELRFVTYTSSISS